MDKFVDIDEEKCDFCAKCVPVCPQQVFDSRTLKARAYVRASRWFLCDGCGACVEVCDKEAIQVGDFTPSFVEESICYFNEPGPQNTLKVCEIVAKKVKIGIRYVVVTSISGATALVMAEYLKGLNAKLIVFTLPPAWSDILPYPSVPSDIKQRLESLGIKIMEGASPAIECGPETMECQVSYTNRRTVSTYAIWELLHGIGGQGFPTAVEAVFTAVKEREVPVGAEVIGVGGTGYGADTAIVMKATPYDQMLSGPIENRFDILEILAVPKRKRRYW